MATFPFTKLTSNTFHITIALITLTAITYPNILTFRMGNILGYGENTQTTQNSGNPPNQSELNSTPVRKGMTVCDPRSPAQFHRTPVVVKDSVKVIEDPRSPISSVNRTPIGKKIGLGQVSIEFLVTKENEKPNEKIQETPVMKNQSDNLRRQVKYHIFFYQKTDFGIKLFFRFYKKRLSRMKKISQNEYRLINFCADSSLLTITRNIPFVQ